MDLHLTKNNRKVLRYYLTFDKEFCRALSTIAEELGVSVKTVQRTNAKLMQAGMLIWLSGHGNRKAGISGQANRYKLDLRKCPT